MSAGMFSIGGIASGLDTHDIIDQLMKLERQPIERLEARRLRLDTTKAAWGQVNTKLSSLRSALDGITGIGQLDRMKASSSNQAAVGVTAGDKAVPGELSFSVVQLAQRMQQSSADTFSSLDEEIGTRTLTIDDYDVTDELDANATLGELIDAVNGAGVGVTASALQVQPGEYRLVLTANQTGSDGAFEVTADEWDNDWDDPSATTQAAQDAQLDVGGITVTRSSNTITDLIDGATITLNEQTTGPVTVRVERDVDAAVDGVKGFVNALNGVLTTLKELTSYDPESGQAGPLQRESAASRLAFSLRSALSGQAVGMPGASGLASTAGISLNRHGTVDLDEAALRAAFEEDFEATSKLFSRAGSTTTEAARFTGATSATQPGTYEVAVTKAAEVASVLGADPYEAPAEDVHLRITLTNGTEVTATVADGSTAEQAADALAAALAAAGVTTVEAGVEDGRLSLAETRTGSAHGFTVTEVDTGGDPTGGDALGLAGTHAGADVEGTINGEAAAGTGSVLRSTAGASVGLQVRIDGAPDPFEVSYTTGVAGAVSAAARRAEGAAGTVAQARAAIDSRIEMFRSRIEAFERRLELRETALYRQFTALERTLGQLQEQGAWLDQQVANLSGGTRR